MAIWLMKFDERTMAPSGQQGKLYMPSPDPAWGNAWPDFEGCHTSAQIKKRLREAWPDHAPEAYNGVSALVSRFMTELHREDVVILAGDADKTYIAAEITGPFIKSTDGGYILPVRYLAKTVNAGRLRKFRPILNNASAWPQEVKESKLRTAIRDQLRLPGTKFAGWKWVLAVMVVIKLIVFAIRLWKTETAAF